MYASGFQGGRCELSDEMKDVSAFVVHDAKLPMKVSAVTVSVSIVCCVLYRHDLAINGLRSATATTETCSPGHSIASELDTGDYLTENASMKRTLVKVAWVCVHELASTGRGCLERR